MKKMCIRSLGLIGMAFSAAACAEETMKESRSAAPVVNVLIVGLDNVNSNYFPKSMIMEKADKLSKASRKSSSKITTAVLKSIEDRE